MIELSVQGMSCGHCEKAVEKAVRAISAVDRVVEVSHQQQRLVLAGNPDMADVIAAIEEAGYSAEALS